MSAPTIHELKTIEPFFTDIVNGNKTFELRKDDRPFKLGDVLLLRQWDNQRGFGASIKKRIVYILRADDQVLPPEITGIADGHVILGLAAVEYRSFLGWTS